MLPRTAAAWYCCAALAAAPAATAQEPSAPRIDGATPLVRIGAGAEICVCGRFPTPEAARALRLDGRPLEGVEPLDERVVTARLPAGLAPGLHAVTGTPDAGYGAGDEAAVRAVVVNEKVCRRPFGRRRIHFLVSGTEEPVKLRVRNLTPDQVKISGGAVQDVTTSGGSDNQKVLKARVLRSGRWQVNAILDAPRCPCAGAGDDGVDPERREHLARRLAEAIGDVEEWFGVRTAEARAVAPGGAVPASEAREVLDELETRLLDITAAPELAALRAWVADRLSEERTRWAAAQGAPLPTSPRPALVLTRHAPGARQKTPGNSFDGLVQRIGALFADLRRVSVDLVVDLCVRSDPTRADVWVQPKRYPPGRRTELTDTEFQNLTRGLYVVRVERPGQPPEELEVDLVSETGIYLSCNLAEGWCDRTPEPPGFSCREPEARRR